MKRLAAAALWLAWTAAGSLAAARDNQPPDREMLKMMEFLRQMEMIKQMEILRDMHHLENAGAQSRTTSPRAPEKKKETTK